jgi:hypothetical protein
MMRHHSRLFRWVCHFIKYFFLLSFSLAAFCIVASLFEAASFALLLLNALKDIWLRLALGSLISFGFAAVLESVE